jgi:fructokinase
MNFNIVAVGEVLWDLLLTGRQLGGAPANFAYHAHALGAQVDFITRVGNDDDGREIIRRFQVMGMPVATIQIDETAPTGTTKVTLSGDGLPHFTVQENVAWDYVAAAPKRSPLPVERTQSVSTAWPSAVNARATLFDSCSR